MIFFKDAKVVVNGSGLIADTASVNLANNISSILSLGKKNIVSRTTNGGIEGRVNVSYIIEPGNEPVNGLSKYIKNNELSQYDPCYLEIAGISGSFYLDTYTVRIGQNEPASANASFISFGQISGDLNTNTTAVFNPRNNSGIAHAYTTTFFAGQDQITTGSFYNLDYEFKANWKPQFTIGQLNPTQILLTSAEERFSIERDFYKGISITGEYLSNYSNIDKVKLFELSYLIDNTGNYLDFDINSHFVRNVDINANLDDVVKVTVSAEKVYN